MTATNQIGKTLGEQMADLLRRKPKNFDVTFSVGPDKIKVEAVKFVLKAASTAFEREFEENWENGVVTDDNGIPLPNLDPTAFQLFVNLLILDAWSVESLKALNLSLNNLLNLLGLCRRYEITKAIENLEEAADDFIQSFGEYKNTDAFLEISRENLKTIFSFENIPLNETRIFECACRWANNRCAVEGLESTGENYRKVLGASLFEIRFPTMSTEEFTKVWLLKNNLLKAEEKLAVYEFIGLDMDRKKNWDRSQLPFKTNRREINTSSSSPSGCSILSLPPQFKLTTNPSFVCDGTEHVRNFQVNEKISLLGVGFLGPIDGNAHFDVTVGIKGLVDYSYTFAIGTFKKNFFARKGKIFYFLLDKPIVVDSNTYDSGRGSCYDIFFSLKGPRNTLQYKVDNAKEESIEVSGVHFHLDSWWNNGNPLAELLFKKI